MRYDFDDRDVAKIRRASQRAELIGLAAILTSWVGAALLLSSFAIWAS